MAAELEAALTVLGLEQYLSRFLDSGFGDWDALTKIAETQLSLLDVRLGHRRRLQRAIARERSSWPDDVPLPHAPDLNQRIQDWLRQENCVPFPKEDSMPSAWLSQLPVDAARRDPRVFTSEYQVQSSSEDSSSYTAGSGTNLFN
ncbi:hypothetical protein ONS96_011208 [Cadophora gregata f. sp. sojae]|nr:hypothetical protein ONS96_011208 [Cadophora gregata f. sp. sojae]